MGYRLSHLLDNVYLVKNQNNSNFRMNNKNVIIENRELRKVTNMTKICIFENIFNDIY